MGQLLYHGGRDHDLQGPQRKLGHYNADGGYTSLCELQRGIQQDEVVIRSELVVQGAASTKWANLACVPASVFMSGRLSLTTLRPRVRPHGDCAIALAAAWMAAKDRPIESEKARRGGFRKNRGWKTWKGVYLNVRPLRRWGVCRPSRRRMTFLATAGGKKICTIGW